VVAAAAATGVAVVSVLSGFGAAAFTGRAADDAAAGFRVSGPGARGSGAGGATTGAVAWTSTIDVSTRGCVSTGDGW